MNPDQSVSLRCMHHCPPWGYCATPVTLEQFVDGGCGGIHGYDGYVAAKHMTDGLHERGLADLVERLNEITTASDQLRADPEQQ